MTASPVIFILGAGANVGQSVARAFAAKGYRVAVAARKVPVETGSPFLHIQLDLSKPDTVASAFETVKKELDHPSVVVYNASSFTNNDPKDITTLSLDTLTKDFAINTISVLAALQQAVIGFDKLPSNSSKTFIFTGNCLNQDPRPMFLSGGIGKSASAYIISTATNMYKDKGYKFYYADERNDDGSPVIEKINGDAHAKQYVELSEAATQGPELHTFVKGFGYKKFSKS